MKQLLTVLVIMAFLLSTTDSSAQERIRPEEMVMRDSAGGIVALEVWRQLLATGKYSIRMAPDRKSGVLYRLTEAEQQRRAITLPSMGRPPESAFFKTGESILPFNEKDMNGERFYLREMQGKVVVLNFWFINCGPCRMEMPALNDVVEAFKDNKEVVFIGIALDEKYELKDFLKTTAFNYHIIPNGRYIANKYGIRSYPTHAVLDKQGKVVFHTSGLGPATVSWVKKSIESALAGGSTQ